MPFAVATNGSIGATAFPESISRIEHRFFIHRAKGTISENSKSTCMGSLRDTAGGIGSASALIECIPKTLAKPVALSVAFTSPSRPSVSQLTSRSRKPESLMAYSVASSLPDSPFFTAVMSSLSPTAAAYLCRMTKVGPSSLPASRSERDASGSPVTWLISSKGTRFATRAAPSIPTTRGRFSSPVLQRCRATSFSNRWAASFASARIRGMSASTASIVSASFASSSELDA